MGKCYVVIWDDPLSKSQCLYDLIFNFFFFLIRMKAQTLVDSLSELMVDASLGTIQCLEEIVSNYYSLMNHLMFWMLEHRNTFLRNARKHV